MHLGHHQRKCRDGYEKHIDNETSIQWYVNFNLLNQSSDDSFVIGCRCYAIRVKRRLWLRLCLLTQCRILLLLNVVAVILDVLFVTNVGAVSIFKDLQRSSLDQSTRARMETLPHLYSYNKRKDFRFALTCTHEHTALML